MNTRRPSANTQRAASVKARQRPATGAYRMNVEHRNTHGQPGDISFVRCCGTAIYQSDIAGSSTHIKGDNAIKSAALRYCGSAHDAAGGT